MFGHNRRKRLRRDSKFRLGRKPLFVIGNALCTDNYRNRIVDGKRARTEDRTFAEPVETSTRTNGCAIRPLDRSPAWHKLANRYRRAEQVRQKILYDGRIFSRDQQSGIVKP